MYYNLLKLWVITGHILILLFEKIKIFLSLTDCCSYDLRNKPLNHNIILFLFLQLIFSFRELSDTFHTFENISNCRIESAK